MVKLKKKPVKSIRSIFGKIEIYEFDSSTEAFEEGLCMINSRNKWVVNSHYRVKEEEVIEKNKENASYKIRKILRGGSKSYAIVDTIVR